MQRIARTDINQQSTNSIELLKNYGRLQRIISQHLPASTASLFALPEIDQQYVNWYSKLEGQPEHIDKQDPRYLVIKQQVINKINDIKLLSDNLKNNKQIDSADLANLAELAKINVDYTQIILINNQPVIIDWTAPPPEPPAPSIPVVAPKKFNKNWLWLLLIPVLLALMLLGYLLFLAPKPSVVASKDSVVYSEYNNPGGSLQLDGRNFPANKAIKVKLNDAHNNTLLNTEILGDDKGSFTRQLNEVVDRKLLAPYQNYSLHFTPRQLLDVFDIELLKARDIIINFKTVDSASIVSSGDHVALYDYNNAAKGITFSGSNFKPETTVDLLITNPQGGTQTAKLTVDKDGNLNHRVYNSAKLPLAQLPGKYQAQFSYVTSEGKQVKNLDYVVDEPPVISINTNKVSNAEYNSPSQGVVFSGEKFNPNTPIDLTITNPQGKEQRIKITTDANGKFEHRQYNADNLPVDKLAGNYSAKFGQEDTDLAKFDYVVDEPPVISINTNKVTDEEYDSQTQGVVFSGEKFKPNSTVDLTITNPQGNNQQIKVTTNAEGKFEHRQYNTDKLPLDKLPGNYVAKFNQEGNPLANLDYEVVKQPKAAPEPPAPERQPPPPKAEKTCTDKVIPGKEPEMVIVFDNSGSMQISVNASSKDIYEFTNTLPLFWSRDLINRVTRAPQRISTARTAAVNIVDKINPKIGIRLIHFNDGTVRNRGVFANNRRSALKNIIRSIPAEGGTPLQASLTAAVNSVNGRNNDALILLITDLRSDDSVDTSIGSICSYVRSVAKQKPKLKINLVSIASGSALNCVAQATGGKLYQANNVSQINNMINQAAAPMKTIKNCD